MGAVPQVAETVPELTDASEETRKALALRARAMQWKAELFTLPMKNRQRRDFLRRAIANALLEADRILRDESEEVRRRRVRPV